MTAQRPYTFDCIKETTPNHVSGFDFVRTDEVQRAYDQHLADVKRNFASLKDFVFIRMLNFSGFASQGPDANVPLTAFNCKEDTWTITPNAFPYDLASDVEQFVVWTNASAPSLADVEAKLKELVPGYNERDYHYFVNEPKYQSIPEVFHVHVFRRTHRRPTRPFRLVDTFNAFLV